MKENYRSRKHCLLLYPEDITHLDALEKIRNNYEYAYILHDKDKTEDGELKKPHIHLIVQFQNAKWRKALAEELGITENYIQNCRNFENALEYLIHYNEETKYQYPLEEVKGTLKKKLERVLKNDHKDENDKSFELIEYIESYDGYIRFTDFAKYCASVGMWDVFRRSSVIYLRLIDEHNHFNRS